VAYLIKSWVKDTFDITCSIGVGKSKLIAKMASGANKPDGYLFVKADDSIAFMDSFKLSDVWGIARSLKHFLFKG